MTSQKKKKETNDINITKINRFSEIKPLEHPASTLVLIDIDDTILSAASSWGSVKQFISDSRSRICRSYLNICDSKVYSQL
jgi:hypothetical protein